MVDRNFAGCHSSVLMLRLAVVCLQSLLSPPLPIVLFNSKFLGVNLAMQSWKRGAFSFTDQGLPHFPSFPESCITVLATEALNFPI